MIYNRCTTKSRVANTLKGHVSVLINTPNRRILENSVIDQSIDVFSLQDFQQNDLFDFLHDKCISIDENDDDDRWKESARTKITRLTLKQHINRRSKKVNCEAREGFSKRNVHSPLVLQCVS